MPGQQSLISDPFESAPEATPAASTALVSDPFDTETARLTDAMRRAPALKPDEAARVLRLQRTTGIPADVITRHLEEVEAEATSRSFNAETFRRTSPKLAAWLAEVPQHAALAQDDLVPLSTLERTLQVAKDVGVSALKGAIGVPESVVGLADIVTGGRVGQVLEDTIGFRPGDARAILDTYYSDRQRQAYLRLQQATGVVEKASAALSNPSILAHTAIESLPLLLGGAGAARGASAALPRLSAVAAGAIGEGIVAAGSAAEQTRQASESRTLTPTQSALAVASGVGTAAFGALGGKIAARLGIGDVDTLLAAAAVNPTARRGLVREIVGGAISEGIFEELPQSVQEQVLQNAAQGRPLDEGLDETIVLSTLAGAVMGSGANVAHYAAKRGEASQKVVRDLHAAAAASKTLARAPEAAQAFLEGATTDGLTHVYAPADTFTAYFQSKGQDPAQVALELTGDPEIYSMAVATGADLPIPTSRYLTYAAGSGRAHETFFTQELRLAPDTLNGRETQAAVGREAQATTHPEDATVTQSADRQAIVQDVTERLTATGRVTPADASKAATLQASMFEALPARPGETALTAYRAWIARSAGGVRAADTIDTQPRLARQLARVPGLRRADATAFYQRDDPADRELVALLASFADVPTVEFVDEGITTENASGESAASAEAIARLQGMHARGEAFVVRDRAGHMRPIVGVDAVDYQPRPGDTFGILSSQGFRALETRPATRFHQDEDLPLGAFDPVTHLITLLPGANRSTFFHETAHLFLELSSTRALEPTATDAERAHMATLLRWFGFEGDLQAWRALTDEQRRVHHEQFATGFEDYLAEGKAPTPELQPLFTRFRRWFYVLYKQLRRSRVPLTDDVRAVMDRMVASEEAIAAAEADAHVRPLFVDAAAAGVDEPTFQAYRAAVEEASRAARADVDRQLLHELRREREAWWQEMRAGIRAQVARDAQSEPASVAMSVIRTGARPDGSVPAFSDGAPMPLSDAALVDMFGPDILTRLPPDVHSVDGGVHPDTLAEFLGYGSGDALVQALVAVPAADAGIEAETDRRMREQHRDLLTDDAALREVAETAVHTHRRQVIAAELRALTQGMARAAIPPVAATNAAAARQIAHTTVRDLKPGLFLQAMRRAAQQAFTAFAANDRGAAIQAKQRELLALALYRAARDAQERAGRQRERLQRYATNSNTRQRIGRAGQDYLDQIDGILTRYEFTKVPQAVLDRRQALRQWTEQLEQQGLPIGLPVEVLDDVRHINWRELTVDELEGVADAVEQIAHLARLKHTLLTAKRQRELAAVTADLSTSIRAHTRVRERGHETRLPTQQAGRSLEGAIAAHRKMASLAREIDGSQDGGLVWEHVIRPMNEAGDREATMNAEATRQLSEIFDRHYAAADRKRFYQQTHIPALGAATSKSAQLSKMARLLVALNWGNETNRQRLRDGRGWTDAQVQAILDTLDQRDWRFVRDVWDFVDSYWPEIKAKQERVFGVAEAKVEATPVFTRFGEIPGGYFPLKYEGQLSPTAAAHAGAEVASLQKFASYAAATTKRNHTKARAEGAVVRPVRLDFGVLFEHVGEVVHDLTHHEMLIDVGRLLGNEEVSQAIYDTHGDVVYQQFKNGLRDVAFGDVPARDEMEKVINHIRVGSTIVGLGWNLASALVQPLGLTQSMVRIGPRWVARGLATWLRGAVRMEETVEWIHGKSAFMANRGRTMQREINEIRNQVGLDTGRLSGWVDEALRTTTFDTVTKQGIADSYFFLIQRMQMVADVPTWLGAYEKAMDDPANAGDEARAIALADQAVLDSQGGGQIKDLASVQRGGAYLKLWTNFYSAFNATFNLWMESQRRARSTRTPASMGRLAVDYFLLFTVPATLGSLLRDALKGEDDPEKYLTHAITANVTYMLGTVLLLREVSGAIEGFGGYDGPAGSRAIASVSRFLAQIVPAVITGDLEKIRPTSLRALNDAAGAFFHYPAGQVRRTLEGVIALMEGRTENPAAVIVGPPREE